MTKNHEKENVVFERFVDNPKNLIAMIAYSFYRLEKIEYFNKKSELSQQEKDTACETLIAGKHFDRFKADARIALSAAVDNAVASALKKIKPKCFLRNMFESLLFGVMVAIIAPFVWLAIFHLLKGSDLWKPFVDWVNSLPKK